MARTDNLTNFLTDVANAIKSKKGDYAPILASNFDEAIRSIPTGGGGPTDIYRVLSIKERDALSPKEDDICLVYGNNLKNPTESDVLTSVNFPEVVTLEEEITDFHDLRYEATSPEIPFIDFNIHANPWSVDIRYSSVDGWANINYMSNGDGTYTRWGDTDHIDFPVELVCRDFDPIPAKFIVTGVKTFSIYQFKENTWKYLDIFIDNATLAKDVVVGTKFYGSDGYGEGTFFNNIQDTQKALATNFYYKLTSLVTGESNLSHLFEEGFINPEYAKTIDISSAVDISSMFESMPNSVSDISEYVSNFNTSNVENMESMFYRCRGVKQYTVTNFDTSKVTNMKHMFQANWAQKYDLSSFTSESHPDITWMFNASLYATEIDMRNFDFRYLTGDLMWYLPKGCTLIVKDDVQVQWIKNNLKVSDNSINIVTP